MIKNIFIITIATTISVRAMEIPLNDANKVILYMKTHPSPRSKEKKSFIEKMQHKKRHLKEKLEDKPECFWMWTPEEGAFHYLYEAANKKGLDTILSCCNPNLRMSKYSIISSIMLSPHISFEEKKEIIVTLSSQNYVPTKADIKLNLFETWKRCKEKNIIQNIFLFIMHNQDNLLLQLPQELMQPIAQHTFYSESLL